MILNDRSPYYVYIVPNVIT